MENDQRQQVKKYVGLLAFRWKMIVVFTLVALTLGLGMYMRMPKLYQASALLSYEQQRINPARMAPEVTRRLRDTVSTLSDIVTSRNNLEQVIKQFNLYPEARQQLPIEDVIELMRKNIRISPSSRGDTFTVTFQGRYPDKVMKVTNALAAKFIEENLKYREERATETSKYTQDELNMAKEVLDRKEQAMRDYKLKYYNEMPDQRAGNMQRLTALQDQYQNIQDSIQDLERTKVMVQEQIALRKQLAAGASQLGPVVQTPAVPTGPATPFERLQELHSRLDTLLLKYTDKHPEVRRIKQLIAKLEKDLEQPDQAAPGEEDTARSGLAARMQDPQLQQLKLQLREINLNIKKLREDQVKIRAEIEKYKKWIAAAPIREAEWAALTRDYNELRRHYDYLVAQNLQAASVEHLERKQKGSKFKIVDPARYPEKPFKPDFKKLILMALAGGIGLGVGLAFGLDFIDTSFKDVEDLENTLGLAVSCTVPYLPTRAEMRRQRLGSILWGTVLFFYAVALFGAMVYFWRKGMIII
ncbi:XrtA system polysaccharide chain length determinant [Desulfolithobacter sp.]